MLGSMRTRPEKPSTSIFMLTPWSALWSMTAIRSLGLSPSLKSKVDSIIRSLARFMRRIRSSQAL